MTNEKELECFECPYSGECFAKENGKCTILYEPADHDGKCTFQKKLDNDNK